MLSEKYNCEKCFVVSGMLIEMCEYCEEKLNFYDESLDEKEEAIRSEQYAMEQSKNKKAKAAQRKIKIEARKRKLIFEKSGALLVKPLNGLNQFQEKQYAIVQNIIRKSMTKSLIHLIRNYQQVQPIRYRGPEGVPNINHMRMYRKPVGYYGFPLEVQPGPWLASDGNQDQWIVAFHGTGFEAVEMIIKQGFKPGPRQGYLNSINHNPLSKTTDDPYVGAGIFCVGDVETARQNNRSNRYICILQCRINPYRAKLISNDGKKVTYIVREPTNIIPYRVLIALK